MSRFLYVVENDYMCSILRRTFGDSPHVVVCSQYQALCGDLFDAIYVCVEQRSGRFEQWLDEGVKPRLKPGGTYFE